MRIINKTRDYLRNASIYGAVALTASVSAYSMLLTPSVYAAEGDADPAGVAPAEDTDDDDDADAGGVPMVLADTPIYFYFDYSASNKDNYGLPTAKDAAAVAAGNSIDSTNRYMYTGSGEGTDKNTLREILAYYNGLEHQPTFMNPSSNASFEGLYTDAALTTEADLDAVINANTIYYAKYEISYKVTVHSVCYLPGTTVEQVMTQEGTGNRWEGARWEDITGTYTTNAPTFKEVGVQAKASIPGCDQTDKWFSTSYPFTNPVNIDNKVSIGSTTIHTFTLGNTDYFKINGTDDGSDGKNKVPDAGFFGGETNDATVLTFSVLGIGLGAAAIVTGGVYASRRSKRVKFDKH